MGNKYDKRYWAVFRSNPKGSSGWAQDYYPDEELSHGRELRQQFKAKILGSYPDGETAYAIALEALQAECNERNLLKALQPKRRQGK